MRRIFQHNSNFAFELQSTYQKLTHSNQKKPQQQQQTSTKDYLLELFYLLGWTKTCRFLHSSSNQTNTRSGDPDDQLALLVQNIIKFRRDKSTEKIEQALDRSGFVPTEDLLLNVLRRHRSDWKPAFIFFNWVCKSSGYLPGPEPCNEIVDVLGRMGRFEDAQQMLDKMSKRKGLVNEVTYDILVHRYAAAHKVEEAINVFRRRKELGLELELDLVAFQKLLMWLCRYKHVEVAETLFWSYNKRNEFHSDIKTWNIILNGWCVRGNVHEAKRFWKDIVASGCQPDVFTCGTLINALTKKGKLGTAIKLFRAMWEHKGCNPDVTICNSIINALCFKKRIPEAVEVFREMTERGCQPNVATYNSLIKYLCRIRRMEKVYEFVEEMERKQGHCSPNHVTYSFLLKSLKKPEQVPGLLERMERNGCKINGDTYNLILKLYFDWDCHERVRYTWNEMETNGLGPDQRSYTIMIHGLYDKGRREEALRYFREMASKGMQPEPRTEILVNSMNVNLKEREAAL